MNFDSEQTRAIQTVGTNILVSASAGAGKTGVLVARLVKRCVEDRVPLNRILAMTFTAAAAGEMKNRLAAQLHEKAASCGDTELLEYLNEQLLALECIDRITQQQNGADDKYGSKQGHHGPVDDFTESLFAHRYCLRNVTGSIIHDFINNVKHFCCGRKNSLLFWKKWVMKLLIQ